MHLALHLSRRTRALMRAAIYPVPHIQATGRLDVSKDGATLNPCTATAIMQMAWKFEIARIRIAVSAITRTFHDPSLWGTHDAVRMPRGTYHSASAEHGPMHDDERRCVL